MKKNIALGLLVAGSFMSLSFFQNCSKITPQDLVDGSAEYKVSANGENIVNNDVIAEVVDLDQGPVVVMPQPDPVVVVTPDPVVVVTPDPIDVITPDPIDVVNTPRDPKGPKLPDIEVDDDEDDSKAVAACISKNFKNSLTGSVFSNLQGKNQIVSNQIELISDSRGKLLVRSTSTDSIVKRISNHHGKLILCNLNVDLLEDGAGKVVLINSHVKQILNQNGKVKSINSTIEKFSGRPKVVAL